MLILYESGFYSLIIRSDKNVADVVVKDIMTIRITQVAAY